ncbi:hypothetical protein [Aeribacillus sp. FSL k6-2211]|uniref:hypothetical protein n=1 Tax=Aeribacillus sp. FSL k6-2211 TaxID=2954608 RepID=UPI0030D474CD
MMTANHTYETNIRIPFSFIIFGLLAFFLSQILLFLSTRQLSTGEMRLPVVLSAVHLLVIGFALMTAMGAMYQLVPVVFLTPIWNEAFAFIQMVVTSLGILSFSISLAFNIQMAIFSGLLLTCGIVMFLWQMFMTLKQQKKRTVITLFVGTALICLLLTIGLGLTLAYHFWSGRQLIDHDLIFKAHILLGFSGWFTLLIFGFSYKMVPMFSLAHHFSMNTARYVYIFYMSGLVLTFISFITANDRLLSAGLLLMAVGYGLFAYHMFAILKKRMKKKLDKPFLFALLAIVFGVILHIAAAGFSFESEIHSRIFSIIIYCYLFGWILLSIIGYLYKIVPFLWWTHRYSKKIGKEAVPTLKQMINEKWIVMECCLFVASLIGMIAALASSSTGLFYLAQGGMVLFSGLFACTIGSVLLK